MFVTIVAKFLCTKKKMLINDFYYHKKKSGFRSRVTGMDQTGENNYIFNSWGFRGPEYDQYVGQRVNICLGDSFTVNVGGSIDHSWCSKLSEYFNIPTLNLGMDGAGNDAIKLVYERACEIFDVQNTFVMYSYLHRRKGECLDENYKFDFVQEIYEDEVNYDYFNEHRIKGAIECALPSWAWGEPEVNFWNNKHIWFFKGNKSDHTNIDGLHNHSTVNKIYADYLYKKMD